MPTPLPKAFPGLGGYLSAVPERLRAPQFPSPSPQPNPLGQITQRLPPAIALSLKMGQSNFAGLTGRFAA
jgi:hypothetical protein